MQQRVQFDGRRAPCEGALLGGAVLSLISWQGKAANSSECGPVHAELVEQLPILNLHGKSHLLLASRGAVRGASAAHSRVGAALHIAIVAAECQLDESSV